MVSDMGRVLVRKAEGDRKRGNLPKPISEMTDEEREKFGLPSRAAQRSGKALNIRGRKGVANIPQAPREERGEGRSAENRVTNIPEALQMNPKTGAVRVKEGFEGFSEEEIQQAAEDYARRQEEMGPAIRGRQREAFEETDEDERTERDVGASFRAGLQSKRKTMFGQIDPETGKPREKGFVSQNIQAGDEGAGLGNIGRLYDPYGTHPAFKTGRGESRQPTEEIPIRKFLNWMLTNRSRQFQELFGANPETIVSAGRSGGGGGEMRDMLIAQALASIRQDPSKFQQAVNNEQLELSVTDDSMGALGSTRADLSDMESINDLARTLRLSQPGAVMFQQLDRMLQEQGLRMTPEAQRDLVAAANPGSFAEVQPMMDNVMQDAMQQATPITTGTAGIAPELVGRGKEIFIDAPEVRPSPQERDPKVTAQQRMDMQLQNEFQTLVDRGMATDEMDDEGKRTMFEKFKAAVEQSIDNQTAQVSDMRRQMAEAEIARNPLARTRVDIQQALAGEMDEGLMNRMASEAMANALEQATLRAEGGEFLSEMDQIYGDRAFEQLDMGRRDMQQRADLEAAPLMTRISDLKYKLRQLDMLPEREKPADYREQMARMQGAIDKLQAELDTKFDATAVRPTEERQRPGMGEMTPSMKRTEYAFREGQNIPVAGKDVQTLGRRGDQSPAPVQIPGMGGEQTDSRLDRTIPESQDKIRSERRQARNRRESGQPVRGAPDFSQLTQEELEEMLMGGGAPAPGAPEPAATAESATPPANMNFLQRLQAGVGALDDDDDEVQTGQWMSVGEQLLKGIQDDMRRFGLW